MLLVIAAVVLLVVGLVYLVRPELFIIPILMLLSRVRRRRGQKADHGPRNPSGTVENR
jgi:hypothetical protein